MKSFQVFLAFYNNSLLINNTKLTSTADDKTTVVVGSEKSAVGSSLVLAHAQTVPCPDTRHNILPQAPHTCFTVSMCFEAP